MKYLKITEYCSAFKNKIPELKTNEHQLQLKESVVHSSIIDKNDNEPISINPYDNYFNENKIEDINIPLDQVYIYDDLSINNNEQDIAYVYQCPICYHTIISTEPNLSICPHCGNERFSFDILGLINTTQMEEIAFDNSDTSTYIYIDKNNNIKVFMPENDNIIK